MTSRTRALGLVLAAATNVVLWQFTAGRYLLYPFTILATWFHEMGHGLCAMLLGGSFVSLRLFPDGSGYAVHSGSPFLGQLGLALIAAAGPLGPALAGASLIFLSLRPRWSRLGLTGVALVMLLSALIWIRTLFGVSLIVLLGARAAVDPLQGNRSVAQPDLAVHWRPSLHFSVPEHRLSVHRERPRVRALVYSDTGQIAAALLLPVLVLGHPADGPHPVASGVELGPGPAGDGRIVVAAPGEPVSWMPVVAGRLREAGHPWSSESR